MSRRVRPIALAVAGLSMLTLGRLPGRLVNAAGLKLLVGAYAAWLAIVAAASAVLGGKQRDPVAWGASLASLGLLLRSIRRSTMPHHSFEEALGQDWRAHIPAEVQGRWQRRRYRLWAASPPEARWERDCIFGTHAETGDPLLADIWRCPETVAPSGLAVIYLHGSAWHYLDKDMQTRRFFRFLASQGHLVMDVAYTLAPRAQLPAMLADIQRAISWLKRHATAYGIDPERIVLMGGSSGAHLALLAAYTAERAELRAADVEGSLTVRGVVSYYGIVDLLAAHRRLQQLPGIGTRWTWLKPLMHRIRFLPPGAPLTDTPQLIVSLLGGAPAEVPERYVHGSPLTHAGAHCPATLLICPEHDILTDLGEGRRLQEALQGAGVPAARIVLQGVEHGFDLIGIRWSPAYQASLHDVERFLAWLASGA